MPASFARRLSVTVLTLLLSACLTTGGGDIAPNIQNAALLNRTVTALAAGHHHACALNAGGAIHCWGNNFSGQLGDGGNITAFAPVASAWDGGVDAVAAGMNFSCALIAGGVQCLGGNEHGQLGDGSNIASRTAVNVGGLSQVTRLAAGQHFLCALTAAGAVRCLGDNRYGQVGDGTTTDAYAAKEVKGLDQGMAAIAAGGDTACALTDMGTVQCWGSNAYELLGTGATHLSTVPVTVHMNAGIAAPAPGYDFSCALSTAGGVICIGNNAYGQIGAGSPEFGYLPYGVRGLSSGVTAVAAGNDFACAVTDSGQVQCWGNNAYGQLGDDAAETFSRVPVDVAGLHGGITAITAGVSFACALDVGGGVHCWGVNGAGQLGDGTQVTRTMPVTVAGLDSGAIAISAGADFACVLTAAGAVKCWGAASHGRLGNGAMVSSASPVDVAGLDGGVAAIAAGNGHACALAADGTVWCWGRNDRGQLGDGSRRDATVPVQVIGLSGNITALTAGRLTSCALSAEGAVLCWGDNAYGELGDGTTTGASRPVAVTRLGGTATAITASQTRNAVCAVVGDALRCWGDYGVHFGNIEVEHSSAPVTVGGLDDGVTALAVGAHHACIINGGGGVQCWGNDSRGTLGDGGALALYSLTAGAATSYTPLAVDVMGLDTGVTALAAGADFSCALTAAGTVRCWGRNDHGQLGDGTTVDSPVPVTVRNLSGVTALAAGGDFACALAAAGRVKCWGDNASGQLGTRAGGAYPAATVPVDVM